MMRSLERLRKVCHVVIQIHGCSTLLHIFGYIIAMIFYPKHYSISSTLETVCYLLVFYLLFLYADDNCFLLNHKNFSNAIFHHSVLLHFFTVNLYSHLSCCSV